MNSSSLLAELLVTIGYRAQFSHENVSFPQHESRCSYNIGDGKLEMTSNAGSYNHPTAKDKKEPGMKFILETLKQPWTSDEKLEIGAVFQVDVDSMEFRRADNVNITHMDNIIPGIPNGKFGGENVIVSVEVKIPKLQESRPTTIKSILSQDPFEEPTHESPLFSEKHFKCLNDKIVKFYDKIEDNRVVRNFLEDGGELHSFLKLLNEDTRTRYVRDLKTRYITQQEHISMGNMIPSNFFPPSFNPPWQHSTLFKKLGHPTPKYTIVKTPSEAIQVVQDAIDKDTTITVAATMYGSSFSDVSMPTSRDKNIIVNLNYLKDMEYLKINDDYPLNQDNMESMSLATVTDGRSLLVRIGAGVVVAELNEFLWPEKERLFSNAKDSNGYGTVCATPGYYWMSYIGLSQVSAMGSGIQFPGIQETILSLDIVLIIDGKATLCRVEKEGSSALTAPASHFEDIMLIQNDDLFNATITSIGTMGVIVSAVVKAEPAKWVLESRVMKKQKDAVDDIPNLLRQNREGDLYKFEMWFSPYGVFSNDKEESPVLVSSWKPLPIGSKLWEEYTKGKEYKGLSQRPFGLRIPLFELGLTEKFSVFCQEHIPWMIPLINDIALRETEKKESYVMSVVDARYFGSSNGASAAPLTSGMFMDASDAKAVQDFTNAYCDKLVELKRNKPKQTITSPFSLRFGSRASALISPQYGRSSCLLEQPLLLGTFNGQDTLDSMRQCLTQRGGRPHWGLNQGVGMSGDEFKALYPENFQKFLDNLRKYACSPIRGNLVVTNQFAKTTFGDLLETNGE